LARDAPGDRERADDLLAAARNTAEELGMTALQARLSAVGGQQATSGTASVVGRRPGVFRREGEYWSLALGGEPFRLRETKGLGYLADLLTTPDREIHALDLIVAGGGKRAAAVEGLVAGRLGNAGEMLDEDARVAYRHRLEELTEDLEQAEAWNDTERATQAREEMEFLTRELAAAEGLGGRIRKTGSASEKARVNVTRAIRTAISRIAKHDAELGRHLDTTIRTGTFCSYMPDPEAPVDWRF
jgi:hypothetical protein